MTLPMFADVEFVQFEDELTLHPPCAATRALDSVALPNHVDSPGEASPEIPMLYATLLPGVSARLLALLYDPPPAPAVADEDLCAPPAPITSTVLPALFQSLGTVQLVPEVRKMTVADAKLGDRESRKHVANIRNRFIDDFSSLVRRPTRLRQSGA